MRNTIYLLLLICHVVSGQVLIKDRHQIDYKTFPQKNEHIQEIQIYLNDNPSSEKRQNYFGLLKTFARYNEDGKIIDYHENKKYEFLSDRYRFFYKDGMLFEIQKKGVSDRTLYKWQFIDNLISEEIKYDRKNKVKYKWKSVIEDNGIIKTEKSDKKNNILYTINYIYNDNNLLEELQLVKKGKKKSYWKFIYDDMKRNSQSVKYNSGNSVIESWKTEYTDNDDTLAIIKYDKRGIAQYMKYYTYDSDGKLIGFSYYDNLKETKNEWKYIYNNHGLKIEKQYYDKKGLASIIKYEYNEDQELINEKQYFYYGFYDPNYTYSSIKNYKYNNKGDAIEVTLKDKYNSIISIKRYIYLYF